MAFWLAGWTAGCVAIANKLFHEPTLENGMFATPFFIGWLFGALVLLTTIFDRQELRLSPDAVALVWRTYTGRQVQRVPLAEIRSVDIDVTGTEHSSGGVNRRVRIETLGKPLTFGGSLSVSDCDAVIREIVRYVEAHCPSSLRRDEPHGSSTAAETASGAEAAELLAPRAAGFVQRQAVHRGPRSSAELELTDLSSRVEPPPDTPWRCDQDVDGVSFRWRGRFQLGALVAVLFLNGFWNSIVGIFLMQAIKQGEIGLHLFLIPFELIGLLLLAGIPALITMPLWRRRWTCSRHALDCYAGVLGIGPRRHYDIVGVERISLFDRRNDKYWHGGKVGSDAEGKDYDVLLHDAGETGQIRLGPLTEAEARWVAATIRANCPAWFR
ncbi:MAG: hypothetical protein K1X74_18750 [Pirellulales bacterium]|nr:hypothetical protein [Pirellulales bacterium]